MAWIGAAATGLIHRVDQSRGRVDQSPGGGLIHARLDQSRGGRFETIYRIGSCVTLTLPAERASAQAAVPPPPGAPPDGISGAVRSCSCRKAAALRPRLLETFARRFGLQLRAPTLQEQRPLSLCQQR